MNRHLWAGLLVGCIVSSLAFSAYISETPERTAVAVLLSVGLVIVLMAARRIYLRLRRR